MQNATNQQRAATVWQRQRGGRLVLWLALAGAVMVLGYSTGFYFLMLHEGQEHSWVTALYWTISTMSTLGYGDVTFNSDAGRLFSLLVLISGVLLIVVLLPFAFVQFVVAPWMDQREAARAPRKVPAELRGHLIMAGLDVVSQALIARAKRAGTPAVVLVDDPAEAARLHDEGYRAMVGALDSPETYRRAGVHRAAMVVATQADTTNTNVAFTVRQVRQDITIAATANKEASVDVLELAGADHVLQLGAALGQELGSRILGTTGRAHVIGSFGRTLVAEAAARGTPLVGLNLEQAKQHMHPPVQLLAVMRRGRLRPLDAEQTIDDRTTLIIAGSRAGLDAYDEQFEDPATPESPVLVLGGGRVGRATAETFTQAGVPYTIVEQVPGRAAAPFSVVEGDAADVAVLQAAGLDEASAAVVTTHDDDLNIYLTLYCRRLRPDLQIVCRAAYERNVATLYRAGADSVLSYATIGATALWNELGRAHRVVITEGNELFPVPVPPKLARTTLDEQQVYRRTGCRIVAAADATGTLLPGTNGVIPAEATSLVLLGDRHAERTFREAYLKKVR